MFSFVDLGVVAVEISLAQLVSIGDVARSSGILRCILQFFHTRIKPMSRRRRRRSIRGCKRVEGTFVSSFHQYKMGTKMKIVRTQAIRSTWVLDL